MVACLKRLLPVGLNLFAGREQELVQHCKDRFLKKMPEYEIVGKFFQVHWFRGTLGNFFRRFCQNSAHFAG